eukprot:GHRR01009371.1.p1 GENE.GHRR01009371.1~~GHRR01009371.1.p1  ORF type:complete len:212 (+),score=66.55 GHRR01009371.1:644-1279(+)
MCPAKQEQTSLTLSTLKTVKQVAQGNGTRYRVLVRGSDTGGSQAQMELLVRPTAVGLYPEYPGSTPYHSHPEQEEAFYVVQGIMGYNLQGAKAEAKAGEVVLVPQGAPHSMWCAGDESLLVQVTLTPAGRMGELFFENLAGLGATYGDVSKVHPLQIAVLFQQAQVTLEGVPRPVSWALANVLAPFARLLGFRASYPQYTSAGAAKVSTEE